MFELMAAPSCLAGDPSPASLLLAPTLDLDKARQSSVVTGLGSRNVVHDDEHHRRTVPPDRDAADLLSERQGPQPLTGVRTLGPAMGRVEEPKPDLDGDKPSHRSIEVTATNSVHLERAPSRVHLV